MDEKRLKQTLPAVQESQAVIIPEKHHQSLVQSVEQIRTLTAVSPATQTRRLLFSWLRIYVTEKNGSKVNLRIPIPIPIIGALLPRHISSKQALTLYQSIRESGDETAVLTSYLDQQMGFEMIRVEEEDELVIIGFD